MAGDIAGSGRAVAPGAAAVLATIAAVNIPAGYYDIEVHGSVSNNAAADIGNLKLVKNGADFVNPVPHGVSGADVATKYRREYLDGINPVSVVVVGAGTAAIVYEATIELTPVG